MRAKLLACVCVLVIAVACSRNARLPENHSKATLIVEQPAVPSGAQTRVGIQFEMDPGWHIYWRNPGDSGEPPRIRWRLPDGASMAPLQWPAPTRLRTTAGTDYSYEGMVVLLSTLQIPSAAQLGTTMEIAGELRWLVCHDVCIPQRAELTAPVRIGNASTDSVARARLNVAAERMPTPLPANFRASATSAPGNFQVALSSNQQIAQAEFFPVEPGQIDNAAAQKVSTHAGVTTLELKKSDQLQRAPERLQGVLVFNQQESYELDVPIQDWVAQKRRKQ